MKIDWFLVLMFSLAGFLFLCIPLAFWQTDLLDDPFWWFGWHI